MIRLHTLGTVELRRDDDSSVGSVTAQPKRLALLVYLAVARPRGYHRRDTLLGLFWAESPESRARNALGQALYFLRRSLGNQVIVGRGNDEVAVAPERLWCDATALQAALDDGRVDDALELYRGDLLRGFHLPDAPGFEDWVDRERGRLRRTLVDVVSSKARVLEGTDPAAAVELLRRALAVAPVDEAMLRRLMTLLDGAGDRAGALATFDAFARRLAAELEIEPSPETLALREAIAGRTASKEGTEVEGGDRPDSRAVALEPPPDAPPPAPARPGVPIPGSLSPRSIIFVLMVAAISAAAALALWLGRAEDRDEPAVIARAGEFTLAVVPFTPATADTGLIRIARELVVPLSANLDGLGDVRAVEGLDVLAAAGSGEAAEVALELAGQLGASRVLYGAIVASGHGVRLEATMRGVPEGERVLRATVLAGRNVSEIADSLTWAVLRELWSEHASAVDPDRVSPPTPPPQVLATRSLPALREYWEGERAVAQDRWTDAADRFRRAVALDSTYWFAYWRYGYVRTTLEAPVEPEIRAAYEANRFEFPEPDRLLIEARMADSMSERLARHRALTRRFPGYWLGWWDYANRLVHDGPLLGFTAVDARAALEQALALRPNDVIVLQHLFWIAAEEADTSTMAYVVRRTHELREATPDFAPARPDYLPLFEMALAAGRGEEEALAREIDRNVVHLSEHVHGTVADRFSMGVALYGFHAAEIAFARRMIESGPSPGLVAAQRRALALTWAGRGAWDSAMVAASRYTEAVGGPQPLQHVLRLSVVGEWIGALPAGAADPWQSALTRHEAGLDPSHRAELAWLDGVLAAAREQPDSIASARQRLRELGGGSRAWEGPPVLPAVTEEPDSRLVPRILEASLEALERAARGDTLQAAVLLAELERRRAERGWSKSPAQWHPYLTAINRLAAASWLREHGRPGEAERLLAWSDAVEVPAYLAAEANATLDAVAAYERARAVEALGRTEDARRYYTSFLRRYDAAVPAHAALVDRARRFLAQPAVRSPDG